jgi:hypothetical protein
MRLVLQIFLLTTELKINIIHLKVVPLGKHIPPEKFFPLPVAVFEVFMWKCPRLVCQDLLDIVHSFKLTTFEVEFEFQEKKKSHGLRLGEYGGFRTTGIPFLVKTSFTEMAVLTGSIVVMQHQSVCMPSSLVTISWTV